MTFAICSLVLGDDYKRSVALCTSSQKQYSKKHGYTYITEELSFDSVKRELQWAKIPLLQKHLADWDWLVWIDGDVLITNQDRKIEEFITLIQPDKFLFIGKDFQGLNSGVFIIRNCPAAHEFLNDVWVFEGYDRKLFHEQTAMTELLSTKYHGGGQILPYPFINIMNAYDFRMDPRVHWLPGDFCIHFAGIKDPATRLHLQEFYVKMSSNDSQGTERIQKYVNLRDSILKNNK
jgi:hypothetical protein